MGRGSWLRVALVALGACTARPAAACGGGGVTGPQSTTTMGVVANSQRIVLSAREDGTTDVIVQIDVPSAGTDFGVLIPTPTQPVVDSQAVAPTGLMQLDAMTAPVIHVDLGTVPESHGGCACGAGSKAGDDDSTKAADPGVSVTQYQTIGPVTTATLTADNADALNTWLADNGFEVPDDRQELLADYVGPGRFFIAVRRSGDSSGSVGLHYTLVGDHRKLSLAFARLGAAPTVAFTVFVAAPSTAGPASPFAALTLDDLDPVTLRHGMYYQAVKDAVHAHGDRAFVLESVTPVTADLALPISVVDQGAVITRLSTILPEAALTEDAMLNVDFHGNVPSSRTVQLGLPLLRYAGVSWPFAVILGRALRRRRPGKSRSA